MADKQISALIQTMEDAIAAFQENIPSIQKGMFDDLSQQLKALATSRGRITNSVENLKLIGQLKNKLERIINSPEYRKAIKEFVGAFDTVAGLQKDYFANYMKRWTPAKVLPIIKQQAIDKTINDLIGQGLQANVVDKIQSLIQQNVTSGGSYTDMIEELRNHILDTDTGEGALARYSKTITTDAINQYSAQYHEAVAQDLGFNWGRYIGSNITTTREFCEYLTKKEWVNKKDLPEIVQGNIDGHQCKLSKSTGLPLGMIPGTNADNFKVRRGGYNCGHQFFWVPDSAVPENVKNNSPVDIANPIIATITKNNTHSLRSLQNRGVQFPDEVLRQMPDGIKIIDDRSALSHYNPEDNTLTIGGRDRADNEYYQKKIALHEGAHAVHMNKKIITLDHVDPSFQSLYDALKEKITPHAAEIDDLLWDKGYQNSNNTTITEQIGILHDTLGSLTRGAYGSGHTYEYYTEGNYSLMEVFAHSITLARLDNQYIDLHPALAEIAQMMKEYGLKILEGE